MNGLQSLCQMIHKNEKKSIKGEFYFIQTLDGQIGDLRVHICPF